MKYQADAAPMRFSPPNTVFAVLGGFASLVGGIIFCVGLALYQIRAALGYHISMCALWALGAGVLLLVLAGMLALGLPAEDRMRFMVCRGLFHPSHGNPLHLKDGEILPPVACTAVKVQGRFNRYILTIAVKSCTVDDVKAPSSFISSTLSGRFKHYAVTTIKVDEALNHVDFIIEDVTIDRAIVAHSVDDLRTTSPTTLKIQDGTTIDLTTSGSILVAGKTRSGKTTGIVALLFQILAWGKDKFGSMVIIMDPKRAELSRLPGVVTVDEDGGGRAILAAMQKFAGAITQRQAILRVY